MLTGKFEIWDEDTNEILVDNLSFEDATEQSMVYQQFYGCGISVVIRPCTRVFNYTSPREEFAQEWFALIDELQTIGNLY